MTRKRRVFDIDMPPVEDFPVGKTPRHALEKRRGPMATAISEHAEALRGRDDTEAQIREENDRLAHELVRLRRGGLITERVPLDAVVAEKLTRDRAPGPDPELDELKQSIRDIGLSNPIRVERRPDGRYELIQGMRRLSAYRALLEETGDEGYAAIPAGIVEPADTDDSYRRMVDENLVRKDISFAEMGALARAYVADPANDCADVDKAVSALFKSASYTKRSYIRAFASLLAMLDKQLLFPNEIPRNVGVALKRRLESSPGMVRAVTTALAARPERDAREEVAILRSMLDDAPAVETAGAGGGAAASPGKTRKARTTFQISRPEGVAKCTASNGRLDLRFDLDFSRVDRARLEQAVADLIDTLRKG